MLPECLSNGAIAGTLTGAGTWVVTYFAGFTSSGIAAGSAAAAIQSTIGNVAAGSLFATMTSIGMTSVLPLAASAGVLVGATVCTVDLFTKS